MSGTTCPRRTLFHAIVVSLLSHVVSKNLNTTESCAELYEKGVDAYLDNDFERCVSNFEAALALYRSYTKKLQICRLRCAEEAELSEPLYHVDIENLRFYEKAIRNTLCIIKCKEKSEIFGAYNIDKETESLFENRKPYEYLHICYFQTQMLQKAASAAYTYLVIHPKDDMMLKNLKYYSKMESVDMREIVNFEADDYVYLYAYGSYAYDNKDWDGVINYMEESLSSYLHSEDLCRKQCEGPFDQGWFPDFIPSISNHFTYCLKCKRTCRRKLNNLNGERHENLLPTHYHFLQYAYFKRGNLKAACEAVASYLLFHPGDVTMLANMDYYKELPKISNEDFIPRTEAVHYIKRETYETRLLDFIRNSFKFEKTDVDDVDAKEDLTEVRVTMDEDQLNGKNRFVSDGLVTKSECRTLIEIAQLFAVQGDGYYGKKSPHTDLEKFEGVTLSRIALLVYFSLLDAKYLQLYLNVTEKVKEHLQDYFKLQQELYFSYTHLVCRSALPNSPRNRTDFSHAVHADNCNILENGECVSEFPAYTWRNYSAILYLNSNFEGGDFIFTSDPEAKFVQSSVKPKCGRLVGFSSGGENLHGVRAVKKGTRCAIGLWFTFDKEHVESERELVYQFFS